MADTTYASIADAHTTPITRAEAAQLRNEMAQIRQQLQQAQMKDTEVQSVHTRTYQVLEHLRSQIHQIKSDVAELKAAPRPASSPAAATPAEMAHIKARLDWCDTAIYRLFDLNSVVDGRIANHAFMIGELLSRAFPKLPAFIEEVHALVGPSHPIPAQRLPKGRSNATL